MGTAVIIPVKDELDLTKSIVAQCLEEPSVWPLIVIDNGSTDGTAAWLNSFPETDGSFVALDKPTAGIHDMWNAGIDLALTPKYGVSSVAILNNDLDLGPGALAECAEALRNIPEFAAVCPNYDGRKASQPRAVIPTTDICANRYDGTGGLAGFAMVIAADFLRDGYRFPTDLRWWCGDNDLVLSIAAAGRLCGIVADATVVHLDGGGQTGDWQSDEMKALCQADIETFRAKWGGQP